MYKGIAASEGIGTGKAFIIKQHEIIVEEKTVTDPFCELIRLECAKEKFEKDTNEMADQIAIAAGEKDAEIIRAHILMIQDPIIEEQISDLILNEKYTAERAVNQVFNQTADSFSQIPDELLQQRVTDFKDIKRRLLKILLGIEDADISQAPAGAIILAKDLTPSMTAGIVKENIKGIITESGGKTSHSAIIARAMEIPAVLGIENICQKVKNTDVICIDGTKGEVVINPDQATIQKFQQLEAEYKKQKESLSNYIGKTTRTKDGTKIELVCNIAKPEEIKQVIECDGEGIGLFRTEFLFMDTDRLPTEQEQFESYKQVAQQMKGKPVIIRTLDIGGDKAVPYLGLEQEENPFLGFRAIRFCLQRTDIYITQLKAIVKASAYGNIKIMVPFITKVEELREVKKLVSQIMATYDEEGIAYNKKIEIGIMIETPAACLMADALAKEAAFFSIGTNDLTGYTMAVDRGNAKVAHLYSTYNPAVLRAIKRIIECAKKEKIMVGMCGEAAADPKLIQLFLALGLDEFSVSPASVLKVRKVISECDITSYKEKIEQIMQCSTEQEINNILN